MGLRAGTCSGQMCNRCNQITAFTQASLASENLESLAGTWWGGVEVYHAPRMQMHFRLVHDCMPACVYWKYKPQLTSIVQGNGK